MGRTNYVLIQIYDEEVPLAALPDSNIFALTVVAMVLIVLVLMAISYWISCMRCRKRITELDEKQEVSAAWNLWSLQKTVNELELQKAGELVMEI